MKLSVVLLFLSVLIAIFQAPLIDLLLSFPWVKWSWAQLVPKLLIITAFILIAITAFRSEKKVPHFLISIGVVACFMFAFANRPIYNSDYSEKPENIKGKYSESELTKKVAKEVGEFEGAILFADPDCPHCAEAAKHFSKIGERTSFDHIKLMLFTTNDSIVDSFKQKNGLEQISHIEPLDELTTVELNEGSFPSILYFKNGDFHTRWFGNDFGYVTFDRIEAAEI